MASSPVAEPAREAGAMVPVSYRVARRRQETHESWTLELEPVREALEPLAPGQFAMLYAFGKGEVPISVSRLPQIHTIRAVGSVSAALCDLRRGDVVGVRGPFGTAWPIEAAEGADVVVIAGGIGIAPLRPAIDHVLAHRERYGEVVVLYGGRSPEELLYTAELEGWRGRLGLQVEVAVDQAPAGWFGRVGVVTTLVTRADFDPHHTVAMVCGPEVMMRVAAAALQERGVPSETIHVSFERSMKCAIRLCGHCQLGPEFVCHDGPVFTWDRVEPLLRVREL
jgi:NAD(P)H-flavin reductase